MNRNYIPKYLQKWRVKAKRDYVKFAKQCKLKIIYFYIIEVYDSNERFIKVGITANLRSRFKKLKYEYTTLNLVTLSVEDAWRLESKALNLLYKHNLQYSPNKDIDGKTECFNISSKKHFDEILKGNVKKSIDITSIKKSINKGKDVTTLVMTTKVKKPNSEHRNITVKTSLFSILYKLSKGSLKVLDYIMSYEFENLDHLALNPDSFYSYLGYKTKGNLQQSINLLIEESILIPIKNNVHAYSLNTKYFTVYKSK